MAEQNPNEQPENLIPEEEQLPDEPFISPRLMLFVAAFGLLVAFFVWVTQPEFNVVGFGGLALAAVAIIAYLLLNPQGAKDFVTGRTVRFGGVSVIVTVVLIVALVAVYTFVRGQSWRVDVTQRNQFSLTEASRTAMQVYAADPSLPAVQMLVFYDSTSAARRDRETPLLDDYVSTTGGKVSYQVIDLDQNPQLASQYSVLRAGTIVLGVPNENGQLDPTNVETVTSAAQEQLTNAVLRASAQGDFAAYFLNTRNNTSANMSTLRTILSDRFDWTVEETSLLTLNAPDAENRLGDERFDGQVVVIPGGSAPLSDDEMAILTEFLNNGGDLVIFASDSFNDQRGSLATADNLNDYLFENFGLRINNDVVLDNVQSFRTIFDIVSTDLDTTAYISTNGVPRGQAVAAFVAPHTITIAETLPANVRATALARSSAGSYTKSDFAALLTTDQAAFAEAIAQREEDPRGPFVLAAQAENTATGARVVIFGSPSIADDQFAVTNTDNFTLAVNSLVWTTNFNNFVQQITVQQEQSPQNTPIFADAAQTRTINLVTLYVLPFGVLLLGVWVWWSRREKARS